MFFYLLKELYDTTLSLISMGGGPSSVRNFVASARTTQWLRSGNAYLLSYSMHKDKFEREQNQRRSLNISISSYKLCKAWPHLVSHCDGYGGSLGPTKEQYKRQFCNITPQVSLLADAVMQGIGGRGLSEDTTYWAANTITVDATHCCGGKPVKGLSDGKM